MLKSNREPRHEDDRYSYEQVREIFSSLTFTDRKILHTLEDHPEGLDDPRVASRTRGGYSISEVRESLQKLGGFGLTTVDETTSNNHLDHVALQEVVAKVPEALFPGEHRAG